MLVVKKFGGSSVANKERIFNVAGRCAEEYQKGNDVVVVLSAMGDTTDELLDKAEDINPNASKRELDMLLTTGEQISVSLMAMALQAMNIPAISLNAFQVQMHSTSRNGNARFKRIDTDRIQHELGNRKVVIVTGFQGVNKYDDYTTLGRGGSDTTAVALAAVLHADQCEIYTDVEGVYTADPRVVKNARKIEEITYDEMLELATSGAKVLHNRSVEMAKKYGVELVVRSSLNTEEGTVVKEVVKVEKMLITGVAADKNTARISVIGVEDKPGIAFKIFNTLSRNNINVDIILQSVGREGTKDISFTVSQDDLKEALAVLEERKQALTIKDITHDEKVAKISIVGAGMLSNPGVAATMFESLCNSNININMISTSEIRITVLIDEKDADNALVAVHDGFGLED
ncbi:aspartate kinase [Bariatricus massiliensis]|uniref:Aspartokinase n=1 Tax=Bariatricus massiliensis TaxID=1745713 RepID=A0ABS8DIY1_9FIRM|nr:aspartate kinase [Bariatricus massiliensis]MCB7305253.1 aspartate kinase [Bariatricus massiliensis]MCB7375854.1 aspartate kinase [Bariatricus massiliensis]MCB7388396.1 aspartate kinase [Bariatricus massiliensis]MCB7412616.1 aspartate kinase [Bariatricus massiliensis]MCQ5254746.1 aspartate kinase [Bariatricus massiliensis]